MEKCWDTICSAIYMPDHWDWKEMMNFCYHIAFHTCLLLDMKSAPQYIHLDIHAFQPYSVGKPKLIQHQEKNTAYITWRLPSKTCTNGGLALSHCKQDVESLMSNSSSFTIVSNNFNSYPKKCCYKMKCLVYCRLNKDELDDSSFRWWNICHLNKTYVVLVAFVIGLL